MRRKYIVELEVQDGITDEEVEEVIYGGICQQASQSIFRYAGKPIRLKPTPIYIQSPTVVLRELENYLRRF